MFGKTLIIAAAVASTNALELSSMTELDLSAQARLQAVKFLPAGETFDSMIAKPWAEVEKLTGDAQKAWFYAAFEQRFRL